MMGRKSPACLMIQGTGSDSGKSTITAGLARLFTRKGLRVMPFKPQNMSNNAAVTIDGGEIGRAQAFQAFAANITPTKYMNPILLKPETDGTSQLIICGQCSGKINARDYYKRKTELLKHVTDAFQHISKQADIILVEGAGSPAEVNLREHDIANMGFATAINAPVILVADIDRGGVIASIIGTHHLLTTDEKKLLKAYIINQFRGDESLFNDAIDIIGKQTNLSSLGIVPFFNGAKYFADEDSMALTRRYQNGRNNNSSAQKTICIIRLNTIANADDFTPLERDNRLNMLLVAPDEPLPPCDWVILAGSKNTINDLLHLRQTGMSHDIYSHLRRGGKILGICAGFQMLGVSISDPHHIEGDISEIEGLGLLPIKTSLGKHKVLENSNGQAVINGKHYKISGYEIHLGETHYINEQHGKKQAWLTASNHQRLVSARLISSQAEDKYHGQVFGCYFHGLFNNADFYQAFFGLDGGGGDDSHGDNFFMKKADTALDEFADMLETKLDIEKLLGLAREFRI